MELDVWIEDLKLAVEYQGEHHFQPSYWIGNNLLQQQKIDQEKRDACQQVVGVQEQLTCAAWDHIDRNSLLVGWIY